ncbi:MAG: hypothetical protein BBJ57_02180 [Desulfobacterales bacterium PC51MH44]|nr:MAG: hypothetical protein BBJ57_02180 [Desulfobacterales bacterium PC51MH44]
MYESTKDQIKYERREGLDSQLIDSLKPEDKDVGRVDDGWLETIQWRKAMDADVWVIHSGIPPPLQEHLKKYRDKYIVVAVMHGPCEHMIFREFADILENKDQQPYFSVQHVNSIWNHDACVVINQHEYDISKLYDEYDKLVYIPNSIDLERYNLEKTFTWDFRHHPAILSCDVPRIEKIPVHILFSMPKVIERIAEARLNMFALPFHDIEFFRNLVCRSKKMTLDFDCCENFLMKTNTLAPFIKGGDIGFNSNYTGIMSRVHMEMMTMGVPVVSYNGDYTDYHAKIFDLDSIAEQIERCWNDLNDSKKDLKQKTMDYAYKHFDRGVYVKKYVELYQKLKEAKNGL